MRHKLVKYCSQIHIMAKTNFASWIYSSRTICLILFVAAFCCVVVHNHCQSMETLGYRTSFVESLYILFSNGGSITTMTTLFLLMVNEIPKRIGYQYKLLIRSSRMQWVLSQVLYCFWMVLCMLLLTVICTSVCLELSTTFQNKWNSFIEAHTCQITIIPDYIQRHFTPFSAVLLALLPMFFFWLAMVLIILSFSLCKMPQLGLIVYMLMLVGNVVIMIEPIRSVIMPVNYSTLQNIINTANGPELEAILRVFLFYLLIIAIMIVFVVLNTRWTDLSFHADK